MQRDCVGKQTETWITGKRVIMNTTLVEVLIVLFILLILLLAALGAYYG